MCTSRSKIGNTFPYPQTALGGLTVSYDKEILFPMVIKWGTLLYDKYQYYVDETGSLKGEKYHCAIY
jgi:hypothetical protein